MSRELRLPAKGGDLPAPEDDSDQAKLAFERWRAEEEIRLKHEELDVKRQEISKSRWSSPLLLAVVGLFASVVVNILQNYFQGSANTQLERQRFESGIIQKALETANNEEAGRRLKFLLDLGLITDQNGKIASYVEHPETIPVQPPGDFFTGVSRRAAKLSVGTGPTEKFKDISDLIASLPSEEAMAAHEPPITNDPDSRRVVEEQRNIQVRAYLYAASKLLSNDYSMIIGGAPGTEADFMRMVVSGLPPPNSPAFKRLKEARDACKTFFGGHLPENGGYHHYSPPIPVEVEGSLFFEVVHLRGPRPGPAGMRPKTVWEIHPVTKIVFEPKP